MAQVLQFDPTSDIIQIKCQDSEKVFVIHEDLLKKVLQPTSFKILTETSFGETGPMVTLPHTGIKHLFHWLYSGRVADPGKGKNRDYRTLEDMLELINAYGIGRDLECVDFMDAAIDGITQFCFSKQVRIDLAEFATTFADTFAAGSRGRQLAVDFLVHDTYRNKDGEAITDPYEELRLVEDDDFLATLARCSLECDGNEVKHWNGWKHRNTALKIATGHIASKRGGIEGDGPPMPWEENPCQYHGHTVLKLPCYSMKRRGCGA